jgi:methylglutaconyl-CoA hydratase
MRPALRNIWSQPLRLSTQIRHYSVAVESPAIRASTHPAPHAGNIRVLLLDQPHNRNALSRRLCDELRHHVEDVRTQGQNGTTRALVIASNVDRVFCAGADLKERKTMTQAECVAPQLLQKGN